MENGITKSNEIPESSFPASPAEFLPPESELASLPQKQQNLLNSIDQGLVQDLSKGPSSLIDQSVIGMMQDLKKAEWPKLKELLLTPGAAWRTLMAIQKENTSQVSLRHTVADTALELSKLAEQDMKGKIFGVFMNNLRKVYGDSIQAYCQEHHIKSPMEGSRTEQLLLIRINSTQLGLEKYKEHIATQWEKFAQQRAKLEGQIALSKQKEQMLPDLIESEKHAQAFERVRIYQGAAHLSSIVGGSLGAVAGGLPTAFLIGAAESIKTTYITVTKWFDNKNRGQSDKPRRPNKLEVNL